jgi:hypothetical protein
VKGIQVSSNKVPGPFQRGDNHKNVVGSFENLLIQNHWANFNQTWHISSLGGVDSILSEGYCRFPRGDNSKRIKIH